MSSRDFWGFPPYSLVTASSEGLLGGCDEPAEERATTGRISQFIPVGANEVERLSVLLLGGDSPTAEVPARVYRADSPGESPAGSAHSRPLAETTLYWKGGSGSAWLDWELNLSPLSGLKVGGFLRLDLELPPAIRWVPCVRCQTAAPSSIENRTFCFRVFPPQPCFWAANVLPEEPGRNRFTGVWKSDPTSVMPQWLEVSWRDPLLLEEVVLDFPNSPECPRSYRIEAFSQSGTRQVEEVTENESNCPRHRFQSPFPADRIRLVFLTTAGASAVAVERIQVRSRQITPPSGGA